MTENITTEDTQKVKSNPIEIEAEIAADLAADIDIENNAAQDTESSSEESLDALEVDAETVSDADAVIETSTGSENIDLNKSRSDSKRLGKGLDALFNEANFAVGAKNDSSREKEGGSNAEQREVIKLLPVTQLEVGRYQPRKDFESESLDELAASIKKNGILQPILVRQGKEKESDIYEIIAGERRWRASLIAGIDQVPVIIKDIQDKDALAIGLIENLQREDLNAMEESEAYMRLMTEFELTQEELGNFVQKSRSHVANFLRLNDLTDHVKSLVHKGKLSFGHARALLAAKDKMDECADHIIAKNLSVREAEKLIKSLDSKTKLKAEKDPNDPKLIQLRQEYQNLANDVAMKIGLKVLIQNKNNEGQFVIRFKKADELSKIVELLTSFEEVDETKASKQ